MTERIVYQGDYGPYLVDCYYCGSEVTRKTHGWNASEDGKLWLVHSSCIEGEKREIIRTRDWGRGERFVDRHCLSNPLSIVKYKAKCGCIVEEWYDSKDRVDKPSLVEYRCLWHTIKIKWPILILRYLGLKDFVYHRGKDWYEKYEAKRVLRLRKMIANGILLSDPYGRD